MWALKYTKAQCEFLKKHSHLKNEEITNLFNRKFEINRTVHGIQNKLSCMGLGKTKQRNRQHGETCSYHAQGYLLVKTSQVSSGRTYKHYMYKHVAVWEKKHGAIPKGYCLKFLDGDNQNCSLDNLALFSRLETFYLNLLGYNEAPEELRGTIILTARLKARVTERRKDLESVK